jgi:quinolinate synthase
LELRKNYPEAKVVVHPECRPEVIALADEVLSTGGMCRYARRDDVSQMVVGTEIGIIYRLRKENPGKMFIPVSEQAICPNMKLITLEKVLKSLEEMAPEVKVAEDIRLKAKMAVDRMLEVA